ncbi:phosphatidate phosphatase PAH1 isoform X1 [Coffea eugenioides]|uniref:phosphatidate phosphatase PAH1 isoform X1 n=1 Tax=Coffea eugenioides TaxID=49369 RepID=UPI000F61475B|nr:phosphatidate phosphatase PAH1 isoform X1 [Coffea eugenioides]
MNVVVKVGSLLTQGVYSVATPFHPFGGAVDIIAVQQQDGSFRSTPWYVRFGKFQGVLKGAEKVVRIEVNGIEANFHMYLDNSGEAYFVREVVSAEDGELNGGLHPADSHEGVQEDNNIDQTNSGTSTKDDSLCLDESCDSHTGEFQLRDEHVALGVDRLQRTESDSERRFYDFPDVQSSFEGSTELSEYGSGRYDSLDMDHVMESQNLSSEVVLVSVDGHILTAPISSLERNTEDVELDTPQFHLGPGEGTEEFNNSEGAWAANYLSSFDVSTLKANSEDVCKTNNDDNISEPRLEGNEGYGSHLNQVEENHETEKQVLDLHYDSSLESTSASMKEEDVFGSCLEIPALAMQVGNSSSHDANSPLEVLEVAKDSQDKSPQRSLSITGSEGVQLVISRADDELSPLKSNTSGSVSSPDLQVPAETIERNTFDTDISGSASMVDDFIHTNGELEKEVNVLSRPQASISEEEITISDNVKTEKSAYCKDIENDTGTSLELSLCRHLLQSGMGLNAAAQAFDAHRISEEEFKVSAASIIKNENLVVRIQGKYLPWDKAAPIVLGMVAYGLQLSIESSDAISLEQDDTRKSREDASGISSTPSGRGWRLWPNPFRRVRRIEHANSNSSNEDAVADSESGSQSQPVEATRTAPDGKESPQKPLMRTNVPTSDQIASLNLKEGQNMVTFTSFSRVLGPQKVEAHIYLWKWNARIVISDVDGTITKSDVLGQFMPLVGKDWTHSGIARLFSAIKENGYQLLFLSARAIVQAYITKSFLFNLKQDGNTLPDGPVVISPDGLFPSLYREVIRRAPHEFKIACLEDIKALFPPDYNPFYAGFGNRDTDELSYRKIGIPKGKIFIINPKGEVAINHRIDVKSYTSLHTLVHDMFPPTSLLEQEDYNSWNYWKMPLPEIDGY